MLSFAVIFLAVLLYGALHSALATLWMKQTARRFGPLGVRGYRFVYNAFALVSLMPVMALTVLLEDRQLYQIPWPWRALTLAGQLLALLTLLVGLLQTGVWQFLGLRQLLYGVETQPPTLVVSGLYRWVRHPLYSAGLAFIWLMPSMSLNLLAFNLGISVYIILGAILEERKLQAEFGREYNDYRRRTAMLVPFLRWPWPS